MQQYRIPVALRMRIPARIVQLKQAHASLNAIRTPMAQVALLVILCVVIALAHLVANVIIVPETQPRMLYTPKHSGTAHAKMDTTMIQ
jgi:hypothetical protein